VSKPKSFRERWKRTSWDDHQQFAFWVLSLIVCAFSLTLPMWDYTNLILEVLDYVFTPLGIVISIFGAANALGYIDQKSTWAD
jgi:hypothetical protein